MDEKQPNRTATMITGFTMLLLTIMLIVFSEHGYHAMVGALKLFFEVVFPSLLPFFILSDVLLSTGMVHYLGAKDPTPGTLKIGRMSGSNHQSEFKFAWRQRCSSSIEQGCEASRSRIVSTDKCLAATSTTKFSASVLEPSRFMPLKRRNNPAAVKAVRLFPS